MTRPSSTSDMLEVDSCKTDSLVGIILWQKPGATTSLREVELDVSVAAQRGVANVSLAGAGQVSGDGMLALASRPVVFAGWSIRLLRG